MLEVEGGDPEIVPADPAPRGGPRHRQRVSGFGGGPTRRQPVRHARDAVSRVLHAKAATARASCSISITGTRRATRTRTSPKPSPCGSIRASMWSTRYAGWPAQRKLEYMDRLMRELAHAGTDRQVEARRRSAVGAAQDARRALPRRSASTTALDHPDFYESDLRNLFSDAPQYAKNPSAARFVRRIRKEVAQHGRQLHRQLPVHDRSAARENHRALPRAESAAHRLGGVHEDRLHGVSDGPDDELPAQRTAPGGAMSDNQLRVLALVHRHLIPPDTIRGRHRHRRRRRGGPSMNVITDADGDGPRGADARRPRRPRRHPPRGHRVEAAYRLQPPRRVRRHHDLRSERRQPPRAAEAVLHRAAIRAACCWRATSRCRRSCSPTTASRCRSSRCSASGGLSVGPKRLPLPADRQVADAGSVDRHLAGVGRRDATRS